MRLRRLMRLQNREGAFTLAEVLIVVVIIGILASFVLPKFFGSAEKARLTAARVQISNFESALTAYYSDHGDFPSTDEGLEVLAKRTDDRDAYLSKAVPKDPWGNAYRYLKPATHEIVDYDLWSVGPDGLDGTPDDIGNWES